MSSMPRTKRKDSASSSVHLSHSAEENLPSCFESAISSVKSLRAQLLHANKEIERLKEREKEKEKEREKQREKEKNKFFSINSNNNNNKINGYQYSPSYYTNPQSDEENQQISPRSLAIQQMTMTEPHSPVPYGEEETSNTPYLNFDLSHETLSFESYFNTPLHHLLIKRMPWLIGLLLLQSFNAYILGSFEELLSKNLVITFFISMLAGTAGNSGNQPSVMVTRALASGGVDIWRLLRREFYISFITASSLSGLCFLRVWLEYPSQPDVAFALAITLFCGVIISIFLGISFSYGLSKLRCDAADASVPLLTSLTDMINITILCGVALLILGPNLESEEGTSENGIEGSTAGSSLSTFIEISQGKYAWMTRMR